MKKMLLPVLFLLFASPLLSFSQSLRILTYNVRNAKGMDNTINYDRVAAVIKEAHPDVVAIQELDSATQRSGGKYVLQELAQRCGMQYTYSAAIDYNGGKYGVGILSTESPWQVTRIHLPGREENRTLLIAEFKDFVFCCTHFSLTPADQLSSAQIVNEQTAHFKKPVYLAGDFNARPESDVIKTLQTQWNLLSGTSPTFPSNAPDRCIDYVFSLQKEVQVLKAAVIPEPMASDHRPVLVAIMKSTKY